MNINVEIGEELHCALRLIKGKKNININQLVIKYIREGIANEK